MHWNCKTTYTYFSAVNTSSSQFILAEQMARRGAPDDRIMGVINPPMTQLSLEEQQIQESLMRLDNRLLNIQVKLFYELVQFEKL